MLCYKIPYCLADVKTSFQGPWKVQSRHHLDNDLRVTGLLIISILYVSNHCNNNCIIYYAEFKQTVVHGMVIVILIFDV